MSRRIYTTSTVALAALMVSGNAHASMQQVPPTISPPVTPATPATANPAASPATSVNDSDMDIIVTAQRRAETLERTAVAVSVVSAETLIERAITTETDLQSAVPGLTVKTGQNENQLNFSLRGQSVDPFSSSRPSVLPYFNEVQVGGVGGTALYDLSSVQVLKGPQGTLFGRNSTGGAVLYTSQKPAKEFGGYILARVGNFSARQLEGAIDVPLIGDVALLRVAGQIQRRDGFQRNLYRDERLGEIRRENVRISLTLKPTSGLSNDLVVDYGHSDGNSLSSVVYNVLPLGAAAFVPFNFLFSPAVDSAFGPGTWAAYLAAHPKVDPDGLIPFAAKQKARGPYIVDVDSPNYYRQTKVIVSNVTALKISPAATIKNVLGYVRAKFSGAGEFDGTPYGGDANGPDGRAGVIEQFSEELQVLGTISGRLDYVAGGYYSHETDNTRSTSVIFDLAPVSPPINQINNGKFTNDTYAVYAQGTYDVGLAGLKLTAGGRYSIEKTQFVRASDDTYVTAPLPAYDFNQRATFKKFSWTVGLEDQVTNELLLYAKARRSFRSGGFNYFAPPTAGFGNASGGAYRPETATDVELGAKYRGFVGNLPVRFNFAAYNMWVLDVQRAFYAQIFGNLAAITVNVPRAQITGIEVDGSIDPVSWLTIGGSANYTNARFTSNIVNVVDNPQARFDTYPDTPEFAGAIYANIKAPVSDHLKANLRGDIYAQTFTYFSSTAKSLTPGAKIPGYALANLRAGIGDIDNNWSLSVVAKNVFDKVYYTGGVGFANIFSLNTVVPGDRRTFLIEARFNF